MVEITKPESYRGCPVPDHNHISGGYAAMTDSILTKICSKCQVENPLSEFTNDKSRKNGKSSSCRSCVAIKSKAYYSSNLEKISAAAKIYRDANKDKIKAENNAYYKNNSEIISVKGKIYREANVEKLKARSKKYYENNIETISIKAKKSYKKNAKKLKAKRNLEPEKYNAKARAYREANPEKVKAYNVAYRRDNVEQVKAYRKIYRSTRSTQLNEGVKAYRKANPEKIKIRAKAYAQSEIGKSVSRKTQHKRRALIANATVEDFSPLDIFKRDKYICQTCKRKTRPDFKSNHPLYPHLDHIVPLSLGGEHSRKNTQVLCQHCNLTKSNVGVLDQLRLF